MDRGDRRALRDVRRLWAVPMLVLSSCFGGDEWQPAAYVPGADIPVVVATHGRAETIKASNCLVFDYVGARDHPGPDYQSGSALEALRALLDRRTEPLLDLPPRGYHWVVTESGDLFVYASKGRVTATVEVGAAAGRYGVTEACGGAYGPPDRAWRPPRPPPPVGTTAEELRMQDANRAVFATLPAVPGGRLISSEPQTSGVRTAVATVFRFQLSTGRCEAMARYVEALRSAGFVGGAMETSEAPGPGSVRIGRYVRGNVVVNVGVRASEPGLVATLSTGSSTEPEVHSMPCTID